MIRMVGMTLPMRSNAVARSPLRSPTRMVIVGGDLDFGDVLRERGAR